MDMVESGWIMYLDDDDRFTSDLSVQRIVNELTSDNKILIWKFLRPDKLIYPSDINNIKLGDISGCAFIFNKLFLENNRWYDKQYGDYNFYHKLIKNKYLKSVLIDEILTGTIFNDKIGHFGK